MTTELDVYALWQLTPLACAQQLTELSTQELRSLCGYLVLKHSKRADKAELVGVVVAHLHPSAPPPPAAEAQQLSLF